MNWVRFGWCKGFPGEMQKVLRVENEWDDIAVTDIVKRPSKKISER